LYGHTYCGNPLGAAVALEVLRVYEDERILERAASKAVRIAEAFRDLQALPNVERARSLGMIGAVDLYGGNEYHLEQGWQVYELALKRGIYARPLGNTVYIAPPLNIPDADLDELLAGITDAVRTVVGA
jgi:adenosylmethionine-8-amino-7-oxononanoate aminotransferase